MENTLSNEKVAYVMKNIFLDGTFKLNQDAQRACKRSGIKVRDLYEMAPSEMQGPKELQKMRWEAYEIRRRRKLKLLWEFIKDTRQEEDQKKQWDIESIQISLQKGKVDPEFKPKLQYVNKRSVDFGNLQAMIQKARPKTTCSSGHDHGHEKPTAQSHGHGHSKTTLNKASFMNERNSMGYSSQRASLFFSNTRNYAKSIQAARHKKVQENKLLLQK